MSSEFHFFNSDDSIDLEWVSTKSRSISLDFSRDLTTEAKDRFGKTFQKVSEKGLTSSQLRNFYNEFLRIRDLPDSMIQEKMVLIKLLEAKIHYKKNANPQDIRTIFVEFISELVKQVGESNKRFFGACQIMEAIVGFFPKSK